MKRIFIECDCHSELMQLEYEENDDDDLLYVAHYIWSGNRKVPLAIKLRHIWQTIKNGHPYSDQLVLNIDECRKLIDELQCFVKLKSKRNKKAAK